VHDDVSPIDAPRRAAITPGFYLTHFPGLPKLDLHVEAGYTDIPVQNSNGGKFLYWEGIYRDVYINGPQLMGSWMGREGKGVQAWSTYWFNPRSTVQVSYREAKVAKDFITYGETINDFGAKAQFTMNDGLQFNGSVEGSHPGHRPPTRRGDLDWGDILAKGFQLKGSIGYLLITSFLLSFSMRREEKFFSRE